MIYFSKKPLLAFVLAITIAFMFSLTASAQTVVRKGDTFIQTVDSTKAEPTPTKYTYEDRDGVKYPVFLSKNGKAFIFKVSKRSNKKYRRYIPEITEAIAKENGKL